jgi:hypothetical protein
VIRPAIARHDAVKKDTRLSSKAFSLAIVELYFTPLQKTVKRRLSSLERIGRAVTEPGTKPRVSRVAVKLMLNEQKGSNTEVAT